MSVHEATLILRKIASGDASAAEQLFPIVHEELRRLAGLAMRDEAVGHTLQPTALVNEAYLRLLGSESEYADRRHFMAVAATAMRHILIDHARRRRALRRGGDRAKFSVALVDPAAADAQEIDIERLGEALERLEKVDARRHRVVELRFFGGLTAQETADLQGVSLSTVEADWRVARAWLLSALKEE